MNHPPPSPASSTASMPKSIVVRKEEWLPDELADELADIVIRTLDLAERFKIDLGSAMLSKHAVNTKRPYKHGKAF